MFDKDNSGFISKDEIKYIFGGNNIIVEEIWAYLIGEIDKNGDG